MLDLVSADFSGPNHRIGQGCAGRAKLQKLVGTVVVVPYCYFYLPMSVFCLNLGRAPCPPLLQWFETLT